MVREEGGREREGERGEEKEKKRQFQNHGENTLQDKEDKQAKSHQPA